ncbi:multidrug effflux MFS transporter [Pannonibacter sp. SL95]|jgi:DHA1 family bicyclomycin/chloramphenicol resistance-like MFS transporter|uniref:multidrug effflux MFS transporter n=1 Tax=Pannonibacter sp. SL95 TaxID=2995153 RepID=UPI0022723843|nr:multidrug effflux MFS transporter [Pannonibacter sp. SL95]MCY1706583.1 multidrug effflux MFS transporter [Pannonibacter sp. SL95]
MRESIPSLMSERRTAALGAALVAIGPVTMALYTPAMPVLAEAFDTSRSMIKLTLTAYFAGFALTQLICGPLTDAFGRRPVTLAFLLLYLASTLLATFAPTVEWMIVARTLQGIGAAVGISVSRAIVRDQFTGQTSARIMNTIGTMLAIGPAISPTIGGLTLELFGWREIFWFMVVYGVVLMLAVALWMAETNRFIDRANLRPARLVSNYITLLRDPSFLRPSLLVGFGIGSIYTLATILPFVLIDQLGLSPSQFGFGMMVQSGSFISGTLVTGRLLRRVEADRLIPYGLTGLVLASTAMVATHQLLPMSFLAVMLPVGLFAFSLATVLPAAMTTSLQGFPQMAGAAASMTGFLQFGTGILGSALAAWLGDPSLAMLIVAPGMPMLAVLSYLALTPLVRAK